MKNLKSTKDLFNSRPLQMLNYLLEGIKIQMLKIYNQMKLLADLIQYKVESCLIAIRRLLYHNIL